MKSSAGAPLAGRDRGRALLVIGAEPPPATGMEIAMQAFLAELRRRDVPYLRVDTADPADDLGNRGRWTLHNVMLAFRHLVEAVGKIGRRDIAAVYVPIAQEFPALLRDLAFILTARAFRKRTVVHLHGGAFGEYYRSRGRPIRRLLDAAFRRVDVGIVLTDRLRPALECVLPPSRVVVVPNGVDISVSSAGRVDPDDESFEVLFLSSLFPSKGIFVFLEAIAQARQRHPGMTGVVAGTWPSLDLRGDVIAAVRRLGLDDNVELLGPVYGGEKSALLRRADVLCFPSYYPLEGQPLVVIEAMAAGLPVVATAWRGITDTVVDGETGILVHAAVPELVAEKLVYLATHEEERRNMGTAGRRRYERLYTQRAFGERMMGVLEPLLADGSPNAHVEAV